MQKENSFDETQRFLVTPLLTNEDEFLGRRLTASEVDEEAMGIAFAGSGTTSTTMTYLLYALARPDGQRVQIKLREELKDAGQTIRELQELPYLDAVITETMRLFPTIISTLPRVLEAPLAVSERIVLPEGTVVGMQNYVHHQDPELFPEPEKFLPERWLDKDARIEMNAAFTPFSIGPRNCLGQNLARAEIYLAVSKVVRRLHLTLNSSTTEADMEMNDRFNVVPRARKLLLDVTVVSS
jgi:cytochrome P450